MGTLKKTYLEEIIPKLTKEFEYKNKHEIPKLVKIQISSGLGLNAQNRTFLQNAIEEYRVITGQHPILTTAKKSIAGFKIREGMPMGLVVTLRREKMYSFLEKFTKLVLPRIRDFRGLSSKGFNQSHHYGFGIKEHSVFLEVNLDNIVKSFGMNN